MAEHTTEATAKAAIVLLASMIQKMRNSGKLSDQEVADIFNDAGKSLSSGGDTQGATEVLASLFKPKI